jgi:PhnB protein
VQLNAYLHFNGNCEEAFKFYAHIFNGKIEAMFPHEGSPAAQQVPPEWRSKIMHARLVIGNATLMGSDVQPQHYHQPSGFSVNIGVNDVAEAERLFHSLSENAKITMPLQETFWAARFGMLVDRFAIPWMVNCEQAAQRGA